MDGVRRLNVLKTQLASLLSEKDEKLKCALNRWVDFQKIYTELKNINEWFEQREETLNRFQRIVTQREFEIALEDVKVGKQHNTVQCSAVQCSTEQYRTVKYSTAQCSGAQNSTQHSTVQCSTVQKFI